MASEQTDSKGESVKITNADLLAVNESMLEGLSQLSDYFGFSKVMGQLYGALLLNKEPLSLDDLMERLNISKASVSMNLRTLEHLGMVRQVWLHGRGGRRKYYEAETDFLQLIANILKSREMRDLDRALHIMQENIERLNASIPQMNETEKEVADIYIDRISHMQTTFRFAQTLIASILTRLTDLEIDDISNIELH